MEDLKQEIRPSPGLVRTSDVSLSAFTLWFTGLPCSGKSTLASRVAQWLRSDGRKVEVLDGDAIRQAFSRDLGYAREDRNVQVQRLGILAHLLTRNGIVTLVAAVSPYRQARDANRRLIGDFVEVYVRCPVERCMERDCKGMYKQALAGTLPSFTGVSDPYEEPLQPEITVDTDRFSEGECFQLIQARLKELGLHS